MKRNRRKKWFCLVLSLCMALSMIPATVSAAPDRLEDMTALKSFIAGGIYSTEGELKYDHSYNVTNTPLSHNRAVELTLDLNSGEIDCIDDLMGPQFLTMEVCNGATMRIEDSYAASGDDSGYIEHMLVKDQNSKIVLNSGRITSYNNPAIRTESGGIVEITGGQVIYSSAAAIYDSIGILATGGSTIHLNGGEIVGEPMNYYGDYAVGLESSDLYLSSAPAITGKVGDIRMDSKSRIYARDRNIAYSGETLSIFYEDAAKPLTEGQAIVTDVTADNVQKFKLINSGWGLQLLTLAGTSYLIAVKQDTGSIPDSGTTTTAGSENTSATGATATGDEIGIAPLLALMALSAAMAAIAVRRKKLQ
ncbi:MAG: hypothetical protein Q4C25_09575 [Bacillota bacterium]|nr:hypothetical protein [Bacillota bacterium]